jgi:small subunit ribosomal protein S20
MKASKSVKKRERQNTVARKRNNIIKSKIHTSFRNVTKALDSNDKNITNENLRKYVSEIDKAVKRNVIHTNKGARLKSRIYRRINKTFKEKTDKQEQQTA